MAGWRSDGLGYSEVAGRAVLTMWSRVQCWALIAFAVVLPIGQSPTEIALGVGLIAWLLGKVAGHQKPALPSTPLNILLLAWWVVAAASMVNSVDLGASLRGLQKLLKYFALYLLVIETAGTRGTLRKLLIGCAVGFSVVIIDGLWQWFAGKDLVVRETLCEKERGGSWGAGAGGGERLQS